MFSFLYHMLAIFSKCSKYVLITQDLLRNLAGGQIFAMSLCFKSFKEVCKWSYFQLFQILQLKLQFTPNFEEWWYVWCCSCRDGQNFSCRETCFCAIQCKIWHFKLFQTWILCHIKMLCSSALCWKSPPECLVTGGFSWNNYEFLHMSCICQPLQALYINPCLLKM